MTQDLFRWICLGWLGLAVFTFLWLFLQTAPYGRHSKEGWGPSVTSRAGWVIMEAPSAIGIFLLWLWGTHSWASVAFLLMWELHYVYRAFLYPMRLKDPAKPMPLVIALLGAFFQLVNTSLNGYWLFHLSSGYPDAWLLAPAFLVGAGMFFLGMSINSRADDILLSLRQPGETDYKIPQGWLYQYVSCPNYLGEIIEWTGWAIATWSLPGFTFAAWTFANLAPRAHAHHRWYKEKFPEYPAERRALLPFVW